MGKIFLIQGKHRNKGEEEEEEEEEEEIYFSKQ